MWSSNGFVHPNAIPRTNMYAERALPGFVGPPVPVMMDNLYSVYPPPVYDPSLLRARPRRHEERRSKSAGRQRKSPSRPRNVDPLQQWSAWRTGVVNSGLTRDLVSNTYREIPIGEDFDSLVRPPHRSRHGVYHYSTAVDQATQLQKEDFVNFGIPRARISPNIQPTRPRTRSRGHSPSSSSSSSQSDEPFYTINKTDRNNVEKIQKISNYVYDAQSGLGEDHLMVRGRRDRERSRGRHHRPVSPNIEVIHNGRRHRSHR